MSRSITAELSSLRATVDDLRQRVAAIATSLDQRSDEELITVLYEAERSLNSAERHLGRAQRSR